MRTLRFLAVSLALAGCQPAPSSSGGAPTPGHKLGFGGGTTARSSYLTGTAATVTVASGFYVTGFACYATSAGTLTVTPSGPNVMSPVAGGAIPIPAGSGISVGYPAIITDMGAGSVFVFSGTDSYVVWLSAVGQ